MVTENQTHGMICTYAGVLIEPLNPKPEFILIEDIAHALSNQCRFTGHVRKFYSVAEHSVRVADLLDDAYGDDNLVWAGLLHDASEAYLSDIARPVKRQPEFAEAYDAAETRLMEVIAEKYGFSWPMDRRVKWADDVCLRTEQRDLMSPIIRIPGDEYLDERIEPWTPEVAENTFLYEFERLAKGRYDN